MPLSTFPTGTVSTEGRGSRTFPATDGDPDTTGASGTTPGSRSADRNGGARGRSTAGTSRTAGGGTVDAGVPPDGDRSAEPPGAPGGVATDVRTVGDALPRSPADGAGDVDGHPADGSVSPGAGRRLADLERENDRLRTALDEREQELQHVIDRYERLLDESRRPCRCRRQSTADGSSLGRVVTAVDRGVSEAVGLVSGGVGRLTGAVGRLSEALG